MQFLTFYQTQVSKKENQSHKSIIKSIKNNYLRNKTIVDIEKEYALVKQLLANLKTTRNSSSNTTVIC